MTILPRPSVSPLHSFASLPSHQPSFTELLAAIWRWWRPRPAPLRERQLEAAVVARIVAELEDGEGRPGRQEGGA